MLTAPEQVTQLPRIETVEAAALRAGIRQPISKHRTSDRGLTHALSSQWLARLGERARDRYFTIHHIGADLEAVQGHALPRDAYVHLLGFHRRRTPEGRALGSGILQAHQSTLGSQRVRPAGSAKKASRVPQKYRWARESGCGKLLSKFADRPFLDERARSLRDEGVEVGDAHLGLGDPDKEIVKLAEDAHADLIVLGAAGLGASGEPCSAASLTPWYATLTAPCSSCARDPRTSPSSEHATGIGHRVRIEREP
jgi:hypothetical protein